jgi:transcriptional regulator with XRE-family HTH domain
MREKDGKGLGPKIKKLRKQAGLSQTDLGEKLGVSYQQVQKYERGVSKLSVEALLRLARALDQPIGALLPEGAGLARAGLTGSGETPASSIGKSGHLSEPKSEYGALSDEEKDVLKGYRELADDKLRASFLAMLKAAAGRKSGR